MQRTAPPATISATQTETESVREAESIIITLTSEAADRPTVRFDDSVIDNENLGKKKSKICCIYSKPYDPNQSESSSSDSCSDQEPQPNRYEAQKSSKPKKIHRHNH